MDKLSGTLQNLQGDAKSKLPLGFAGLNDKVSGAAKEAGANVKDAVSDVTGANPVDGGKNVVGQATDKAAGSAKEVRREPLKCSFWYLFFEFLAGCTFF